MTDEKETFKVYVKPVKDSEDTSEKTIDVFSESYQKKEEESE